MDLISSKYRVTVFCLILSVFSGMSQTEVSNWGVFELQIGMNSYGPSEKMKNHLIDNSYNTVDTLSVSCGDFWTSVGATDCYEYEQYPVENRENFQIRIGVLKKINSKYLLGGNATYDSFYELVGKSDTGSRVKLLFRSLSISCSCRYKFGQIYTPSSWISGISFYGQGALGASLNRTITTGNVSSRVMPQLVGDVGVNIEWDKAYLNFNFGGTLMPDNKVDALNEGKWNYLSSTYINFSHFDISLGLGFFIN